ncbi:MAG: Uma2 family endonuclease [Frankiales bacterium]|nr:MAG: Uma2 family endonuclease [Frankiales bacterium]
MSSTTLDPAGPWTFDQLGDLPDDGRRYEVVDGHLVVTPPPSQEHQLVANRLLRQLLAACPDEWEALSEFALPLGTDGRVPDLAVVRRHALPGEAPPHPLGPAEFGLVVEVTSRSTRKTDLFAKPGEYAEAGIALFWRVERHPELAVHPFRLGAEGYQPGAVVRGAGGTCPVPWGEVALDLDRIRSG